MMNVSLESPCQPLTMRRQIDVDDVAFLQNIVSRDAVADHVVDARAAARGKGPGLAVIAQRGRHVAVVASVGLDQLVDLAGGDARQNERPHLVHELSIEAAGLPHLLTFGFGQLQAAARVCRAWQTASGVGHREGGVSKRVSRRAGGVGPLTANPHCFAGASGLWVSGLDDQTCGSTAFSVPYPQAVDPPRAAMLRRVAHRSPNWVRQSMVWIQTPPPFMVRRSLARDRPALGSGSGLRQGGRT